MFKFFRPLYIPLPQFFFELKCFWQGMSSPLVIKIHVWLMYHIEWRPHLAPQVFLRSCCGTISTGRKRDRKHNVLLLRCFFAFFSGLVGSSSSFRRERKNITRLEMVFLLLFFSFSFFPFYFLSPPSFVFSYLLHVRCNRSILHTYFINRFLLMPFFPWLWPHRLVSCCFFLPYFYFYN